MLGKSISSVGWPAYREIDIMEMIGGDGRGNTVYEYHIVITMGGMYNMGSNSLSSGTYSDDFHFYAIEWNPSTIKRYVDNSHCTKISIIPSGLSEFHKNFFIILNRSPIRFFKKFLVDIIIFKRYIESNNVNVYIFYQR